MDVSVSMLNMSSTSTSTDLPPPAAPGLTAGHGLEFHVPRMPQIVEVPEPRPPRKPPITGYDVKTLRKQVDFLQGEIRDREDKHELLYQQNRELWDYTHTLLDTSRSNAHRMKTHVSALHQELHHSHEIRRDLATKLLTARDSKALLRQLFKSTRNVTIDVQQAQQLCDEADLALGGARSENEILEGSLRAKMERLQLVRWQIDENKNREEMEQLMGLAEGFWTTNEAVLRSAFKRFTRGVGRQLRSSQLYKVLRRVYHWHLKETFFGLFRFFLAKRAFARKCQQRNAREIAAECLMQWRLFAATEKFCKRRRRRMLLRKIFSCWSTDTKHKVREAWALRVTEQFLDKQTLRRCFRALRAETEILHWHSPALVPLEARATQHLKSKILHYWLHAAQKERARDVVRARKVVGIASSHVFEAWRGMCKALWQRRGLLVVRFFRHSQRRVEKRRADESRLQRAARVHSSWQRFASLRGWAAFTAVRQRIRRKAAKFALQNSFVHRRVLKASLSNLRVVAATSSRRRFCHEAASAFLRHRALTLGLATWRQHSREDVRRRQQYRHKQFSQALHSWRAFTARRLHERRSDRASKMVQAHKDKQYSHQLLWTLYRETLRRRRSSTCAATLRARHMSNTLSSVFVGWRCRWTSIVYRRMCESNIESTRVRAIVELKGAEVASLQQDRSELQQAVDRQGQKLSRLQGELDDKEIHICEAAALLESRRAERLSLDAELVELRTQLEHVSTERSKLADVEQLLLEERERENEQLQARKEEAQALVRSLQMQSDTLLADVDVAADHVATAQSTADKMMCDERGILQESEETAAAMEVLLLGRKEEAAVLAQQHQAAQQQLVSIQRKLNLSLKDGFAGVGSAESELRSKMSQVRVVGNSASMLEARNAELQKILTEEENAMMVLRAAEAERDEGRELRMLSSSLDDTHERLSGITTRLSHRQASAAK